jgi:hypothetical protein
MLNRLEEYVRLSTESSDPLKVPAPAHHCRRRIKNGKTPARERGQGVLDLLL